MSNKVDNVNQKTFAAKGSPASEVFETIHDLLHLHRGRRQRELQADTGGLTPMEVKALSYFGRHPGATQSDLVAHSGRDKAQIARLIATLKERDLLTVTPDAQDRRVQRLTLSGDALTLHRQLQRRGEKLAQAAVQDFSADELAQLNALLARLRANLEAAGE